MFSREQLTEKLNQLYRYEPCDGYYHVGMQSDYQGKYLSLEDIAIEFGLTLEYGDYGKFKIDEQLTQPDVQG